MSNIDVVPKSTYVTGAREATRGLWLGLLAGPTIYAVYFIVGYLLAEAICQSDLLRIEASSLPELLTGVTVLALLLALTATFLNYRNWRRKQERQEAEEGAVAFMAFGGLLLGLLFTLLIVVTGLAVFLLVPCQWI